MPTNPLVDFQGKTVVVSGASSGIGRAIALMLGKYGAKLILTGRDTKRLEETSRNLGSVEHRVVPMDLAQQETILPTMKKVIKEFGPVYGLCHAAGNVETLPLSATVADRIRPMIEVNLLAGIELAQGRSAEEMSWNRQVAPFCSSPRFTPSSVNRGRSVTAR